MIAAGTSQLEKKLEIGTRKLADFASLRTSVTSSPVLGTKINLLA
jgi:hypothetical protein